jgi:hypothetical protein
MKEGGMNEAVLEGAARIAGAVAGAAISLAYILPAGRREAALRFAVGIVSGLTFGGVAGLKIAAELGLGGQIGEAERMLIGSAVASLSAWWVLGYVMRLLSRQRGQTDGVEARR